MDNTLKGVCERMAPEDKQLLISKIVKDGLAVATAYAYINGTRRPKLYYQQLLQKYVAKLTGEFFLLTDLFPETDKEV